MKVTRQMVETQFDELKKALNLPISLNYIKEYQGYQITTDDEKECPFFYDRKTASQMYECIIFALRAIQLDRQGIESAQFWPKNKTN